MARNFKKTKPLIYVFCEGESEQAYTDFLKEHFSDVASIRRPKTTGLFEYAKQKFKNDKSYINNVDVTDEIWFFYDVEKKDLNKISSRQQIINELRKLRKKPKIKVRLLMTTACIEYWLMLHYKCFAPSFDTQADRTDVINAVMLKEPTYKKGDSDAIRKIALNYKTAGKNALTVLRNLKSDGIPSLEDSDERNIWLAKSSKTFSTVFEAIEFLEDLSN